MNKLLLFLCCLSCSHLSAQSLQTPFETSSGRETGTYEEVILWYKSLAASSDMVQLHEMGLTDSGKPLHLVTIDSDKVHDPATAKENNKTILLINNGIHPGEPDGIEASMMLARDLVEQNSPLLKNTFIAIIPIYNIGGALNRNSTTRVNQDGPESYGFRGNARNYDLNRDFIKADTRNTRSFYELFHFLDPDVFIDTHVSNGADYQYKITHLATQHNKAGGALGEYVYSSFTPALEEKLAQKSFPITPYVNVFNRTPDARGFSQFLDNPRYSTGYTTLFNTLGFMIETHMLKPFEERVQATYSFLQSVLEIAEEDGGRIRQIHRNISPPSPGNLHPIAWKTDQERADTIEFLGYEGEMRKSMVTGADRLYYDKSKPFSRQIPYYTYFIPAKEVVVPLAYVIPQGWHEVVSLLQLNNVRLIAMENDTVINVESYQIDSFETSSRAYEGHYPHSDISVTVKKENISFRAGDLIAFVNQPAGRFLVETLEPEATDSYFSWNFFDTILQQKEGFSPYVFEDMAEELLKTNDALRIAFEKRKKEDAEFAGNWYAQLNFIYENSGHYEEAHLQYPIFRIAP